MPQHQHNANWRSQYSRTLNEDNTHTRPCMCTGTYGTHAHVVVRPPDTTYLAFLGVVAWRTDDGDGVFALALEHCFSRVDDASATQPRCNSRVSTGVRVATEMHSLQAIVHVASINLPPIRVHSLTHTSVSYTHLTLPTIYSV